jgi:tRNA threonylcarbamoyl adenosine modification protein YeaZ
MFEAKEKLILAIETSLEPGSVSILKDSEEIASAVGDDKISRSNDLILLIEEILAKCRRKLFDLRLIAVSIGPGSFTGLRVGMATARGLSLGSSIPCVGVSALEALAAAAAIGGRNDPLTKGVVRSVISSGRGNLIYQDFLVNDPTGVEPVGEISFTVLEKINDADWINGVELIILDEKLKPFSSGDARRARIKFQPVNLAKFIGLLAVPKLADSAQQTLNPIYIRGI